MSAPLNPGFPIACGFGNDKKEAGLLAMTALL